MAGQRTGQNANGASAAFRALVRTGIDGELQIARRHFRAMVGLGTMTEMHAAEQELQQQDLLGPTSTKGSRIAERYRLTRKGFELVGTLARSTDDTIPEALRGYGWAKAGKLWAMAPKGEPVDSRQLLQLMPEDHMHMVYRLVRKLDSLPEPVLTMSRHPEHGGWVHCFHDLDADEWGRVAEHITGERGRSIVAHRRAA